MPKKTNRIKITDQKKAWNRRPPSHKIQAETRERKKLFLIICEGKNTEPTYFGSFPLSNAHIESFGMGSTKTALVEHVIYILKSEEEAKQKEVWVVFDFDVNPDQIEQQKADYNNAIEIALQNDLNVACSNDAFELWFLLHYQFLDMQWNRHQYYEKLGDLWGCNYLKDGKSLEFCRKIYQLLQDDENASQEEAIKRAERLHDEQKDIPFANRNPHTTIYQLIEELNQYL